MTNLLSLLQALDLLNERLTEQGREPIGARRLREIARTRNVGRKPGGGKTRGWVFTPDEIERLIPGPVGRPKKEQDDES